ncbi:glycosyltransferase [Streptomyces antibioticus]|uniref:glycosyltransferase n=1 Tax=Streptomyces antibioticus TaxID=1890 RepID=UPI00195F657F|nr:glycosyltransferase [Streptomyces sp. S9]
MTVPATAHLGRWVVISNPAWPSPYFAELERHAPPALHLAFAADLDMLASRPGPVGVVNLHRLKRLYQEPGGQRTRRAAEAMLQRLQTLRAAGWKIVWTVHNLLPIDGQPADAADRYAADGVLAQADAVVTHTHADAEHLRTLTRKPVTAVGWAAPTPAAGPVPAPVEALARQMAAVPFAVLMLGNITAYKNLPATVDTFTRATCRAHLFLAGPSRDPDLTDVLTRCAAASGGRVHLYPQRVPPEHAHVLYQAADTALCPYRVDGPWSFFTRMIYPSSVGTALASGTPVIAPDLPAIREMTACRAARLYAPEAGPGPALAAAEHTPTAPESCSALDPATQWRAIGAAYVRLAHSLHNAPRP